MKVKTVRVTSWGQAKRLFDAVLSDPRFGKFPNRDKTSKAWKDVKGDNSAYRLFRLRIERHFAYRGEYPGAVRLGLKPLHPIAIIHIATTATRIRITAEDLILCEGGYCCQREEGLAVLPLPPTPDQIAQRAAEIRSRGVRYDKRDPLTKQPKSDAIRSFAFNFRIRSFDEVTA